MQTNSTAAPPTENVINNRSAMAVVTTLFFMWGFLTSLNDILIPHLKAIFELNYAQAMLVQFSFFSAYFLFSVPSGKLIDAIGYKRAMVSGLATMSVGAMLFIPAANIASFPLFLFALMVLASGITILQVSANPYVAVLGRPETASSRLNLTQGFNSVGHTIAPYIGGLLILGAAGARAATSGSLQAIRAQEAATVKLPYVILSVTLAALAVMIGLSRLPRIAAEHAGGDDTSFAQLLHHKRLVLGVIGIFLYVGAEVAIGSFLVNYFTQHEIGDLPQKVAASYVSLYWGGAMVGRFIGSALLQKIRAPKLLAFNAVVACALVVVSMLSSGHVAMWSILAVGLFNSVMFPSIFTIAIEGLGPLTSKASGALVTAIVGGAVIPLTQGALADRIGVHHAFILPALCYVFVFFYALQGFRTTAPLAAPPVPD